MAQIATHNFNATYQEGVVSAVDAKTHRIRVTLPALENLETAWLPYFTPFAGGNQFYGLPDVGELVALILDARGEGGYVLGALYNEQDPTPVADKEHWGMKFKNGTEIWHNRKNGDITVKTPGTVNVTASKVNVVAPSEFTGDMQINGQLSVTGIISSDTQVKAPKVTQGSVELGTHRHTEQGDGAPVSTPY